MAELKIVIPYKTLPGRIVFSTMCTLFPVWAIVAPAAVGFFIGCSFSNPGNVPAWATVGTCLGLLGFSLCSIFVTAVSEDNRIHISKDGIALPPFMLPSAQFRRNRSWTEISEAHIRSESAEKKDSGCLFLTFNSGLNLNLKLHCMKAADLEQLFMAIELWATNCKRSPELVDYQKQIQNQGREVGQVGYTQMWEEELSRRFTATSFMPLEPGHELQGGRLKIVRQLAFGGLSAIYLAQESQRDLVVVKEAVVPPNADTQARAQAEAILLRESQMLSRLHHPNIARVLDHFAEEGRHYLLLEYINGQDLRQYVKQNGVVPQETVVKWGLKILEILDVLHSQNPPIIHRDLTPDNLVITNQGEVVLIDFGAANVFVGAATGTIVGKQAYIPAEQLRGHSVIESDIYSFGGTLFFLLTGKDPLPLAESHPRQFIDTVDMQLDSLIARCSAFEPEDRWHSARELRAVLASLNIARAPMQV